MAGQADRDHPAALLAAAVPSVAGLLAVPVAADSPAVAEADPLAAAVSEVAAVAAAADLAAADRGEELSSRS